MDTRSFWGSVTIPHMGNSLAELEQVKGYASKISNLINVQGVDPNSVQSAVLTAATKNAGNQISGAVISSAQNSTSAITGAIGDMSGNINNGLNALQQSENIGNIINIAGFGLLAAGMVSIRKTVTESTEKTISAISDLKTVIETNLIDLCWTIKRQEEWLKGIHETLLNSRGNECRQLLIQGEKNYNNGFYKEAEDRFKLALNFDNTNFIAHYHLGLLYMHLENVAAGEHLEKAVVFSQDVEPRLAAMAFRTVARYHYANGEVKKALEMIDKSIGLNKSNESLFDMIAYQLALGMNDKASILTTKLLRSDWKFYNLFFISDITRPLIPGIADSLGEFYKYSRERVQECMNALTNKMEEIRQDKNNPPDTLSASLMALLLKPKINRMIFESMGNASLALNDALEEDNPAAFASAITNSKSLIEKSHALIRGHIENQKKHLAGFKTQLEGHRANSYRLKHEQQGLVATRIRHYAILLIPLILVNIVFISYLTEPGIIFLISILVYSLVPFITARWSYFHEHKDEIEYLEHEEYKSTQKSELLEAEIEIAEAFINKNEQIVRRLFTLD